MAMGLLSVVLTGWCANSAVDPTPPGPPLRRGGESEGGRVRLIRLADIAICAPSDNTQDVQEARLAVAHIICHLVERALLSLGAQIAISRSEEHTSELQSQFHLVCRLLLE